MISLFVFAFVSIAWPVNSRYLIISVFACVLKSWNATTNAPSRYAFLAVGIKINGVHDIKHLYFENNWMTNFALHEQHWPSNINIFHALYQLINSYNHLRYFLFASKLVLMQWGNDMLCHFLEILDNSWTNFQNSCWFRKLGYSWS